MTTLGERLRELREARGWSQEVMAAEVGVTRSTWAKYETDCRTPRGKTLKNLADYFSTTTDYLLGREDRRFVSVRGEIELGRVVPIDILGRIPAGPLGLAQAEKEGVGFVPEERVRGGEFFFLRVKGDCFYPRIQEGDLVLVRRQAEVENGELAIIIIGDEDGTLKRVTQQDGVVFLSADNPYYKPTAYHPKEVRIVGKVVGGEYRL